MAAIGYAAIRNAVKTVLNGDALTSAIRVHIEEDPQFGISDDGKVVVVFMDRRVAAPSDQALAAGKRTRYHLYMTLWVAAFSMTSYQDACDARDGLLGNVELVLMKDRTIGGNVTASWLEGGQLVNARDSGTNTFVAAGEIILVAEVSAINT